MKRISSKWTFFYKRIFPIFWFGMLAVFVAIGIFGEKTDEKLPFPFFIIPVVLAVFGYFLMKNLIFNLVDEVYDNGASLLLKNRGEEDQIQLTNIQNVSYSPFVNPPTMTLSLQEPCKFGKEIAFSAPISFVPLKKHPTAVDLIERINAAKNK